MLPPLPVRGAIGARPQDEVGPAVTVQASVSRSDRMSLVISPMVAVPAIPSDATAEIARELFEQAGWSQIGVGDWSWVLADASRAWAARVTPFDPAYRMHAEACISGRPNRWLPHMATLMPLRRDGYVVVMERLGPADEEAAASFCAALAIGNDSGYAPPVGKPFDAVTDADFAALRARLLALLADGARRYQLWGGSDIRPGNIMADARGSLKLVDPIFLRGKAIVDALRDGRRDLLTDFSRRQLEDFLTIPVFGPGEETDGIRRQLALLYDEGTG